MGALLENTGAAIFFGVVVLLVMKLNSSFMEANYQNNLRVVSQESLSGIDTLAGAARILEEDFAKAGNNAAPVFVIADSNRITFRGDIDNNGTVDSVKYSLVNLNIPAGGNPNLKYRLIRRQNTETGIKGGIGVSQFRLSYFDSLGRVITAPVPAGSLARIRSVKIQLHAQSKLRVKNEVDSSYASAYWEKVVSPRNLRAVK